MQPFKLKDVLQLKGIPYEVVRVLPEKVQIENTSTGELRDTTVPEMLKQYMVGTLQVGCRADGPAAGIPTSARANPDTSMEQLSEKSRAATLRKVAWIVKLDDMGAFDYPRLMPEAISRVAEELRADARIEDKQVPHVSTLRRWKKQLGKAQKDVRRLFARLDLRGGRGGTRLHDEVEASITEALDNIVLGQKRSSASDVLNAVKLDLVRKNAYRTASDQLANPGLRTIQKRISRLYAFDVCLARHGAKEAHKRLGDSVAARPVTRILQVIEIDHTPVDLWVVDEDGKAIGRPNLTVLIDRYSRCVVGFFLSLAGHSVETVFGAIRHALMPKTYLRERYPEIQGEWACFGWIEKLLADNGTEFAGIAMVNAMFNLGINLEFCSAYEPNDKPFVERFIRTFNYGFIHRLKGTSLARVADRKGERLEDDACITLPELERLIHVWLVDVYHRRPHAGLNGRSPAAVWAESAQVHPPKLRMDAEIVDIELCEIDTRSLGRGGIEINNHRYTSERLCALRRMLPQSTGEVTVKFQRRNLGHIFVLDQFSNEYFRVDNMKDGYEGISIEQDKLLRSMRAQADPDDSIHVASAEETIRTRVNDMAASKKLKERKQAAKAAGEDSHKVRSQPSPAAAKRQAKPEISSRLFDDEPAAFEEI